jgi:hypothetical protein
MWTELQFGAHKLSASTFVHGGLPPDPQAISSLGRTEVRSSGRQTEIKILTVAGLPNFALGAILAHEVGHALLLLDEKTLHLRQQWPTDDLIVEGFCEVVASQWLESRQDPQSRILRNGMETNPTPIYGDGFRVMHKQFLRYGSLSQFRDSLVGLSVPDGGFQQIDETPIPANERPVISISPVAVPNRLSTSSDELSTVTIQPTIDKHRPIIQMPLVGATSGPQSATTEGRPKIPMRNQEQKPS